MFVHDLPYDYPAGLFYYHPHFNGSLAYKVAYVLFSG